MGRGGEGCSGRGVDEVRCGGLLRAEILIINAISAINVHYTRMGVGRNWQNKNTELAQFPIKEWTR